MFEMGPKCRTPNKPNKHDIVEGRKEKGYKNKDGKEPGWCFKKLEKDEATCSENWRRTTWSPNRKRKKPNPKTGDDQDTRDRNLKGVGYKRDSSAATYEGEVKDLREGLKDGQFYKRKRGRWIRSNRDRSTRHVSKSINKGLRGSNRPTDPKKRRKNDAISLAMTRYWAQCRGYVTKDGRTGKITHTSSKRSGKSSRKKSRSRRKRYSSRRRREEARSGRN